MNIVLPASAWEDIDASTEALLDRWLVQEGEGVEKGQALASAVLVKSTLDIESPAAGRLRRILVGPGERFLRGQALAELEVSP